jgi:hypothetical protein
MGIDQAAMYTAEPGTHGPIRFVMFSRRRSERRFLPPRGVDAGC